MILKDIIIDIHALHEDVESYERKYGILSETFYESYQNGEEPKNEAWVLDWADWAGAYKILLRRREQYKKAVLSLRKKSDTWIGVIEKTSGYENIQISSGL